MRGRDHNLRLDQRGAALIELALAAPILAVLTIGIIDISNAYSRKLALEQGAHRAIEKVMQTTGMDTVEGTIKTEAVCQVNGTNNDGTCKTSPITASNVTVTWRLDCLNGTSVVSSTTSTDSLAFDALTCGSGESRATYIEVGLTDKYTPMFPIHFGSSYHSDDNSYHLSATAGMRTQ